MKMAYIMLFDYNFIKIHIIEKDGKKQNKLLHKVLSLFFHKFNNKRLNIFKGMLKEATVFSKEL